MEKVKMQDESLGTAPIGKLVFRLAVPAVIAQVVNMLYNIVDRMYIGHIPEVGSTALTGLGVCFPIIMIVSAFSSFAGLGGAPLAAIKLGEGDREAAEKILGNATALLLVFATVLMAVFIPLKQPILYVFGASDDTIGYAMQYLDIYLCGTVFVLLSIGLNAFITCQGQARTAMCSVLIGAGLNILLDPLFIFVFNMGVRGAALATIIAQASSMIWVVSFLLSERSGIRLRTVNMKPSRTIIGKICALGISPFVMQSTESLVNIVFNSSLQRYGGDLYVGAMTIMTSVMQMITIPVMGITQGTQPIISYNYGAKNFSRIKQVLKYSVSITVTVTTVCFGLTQLFPTVFARIFADNAELIALVGKVLPIFTGGVWIYGFQIAFQSGFMGMGQAKISLFLAVLRKIILLIPLALILPLSLGAEGVYWAEPIADTIAAMTTATLFFIKYPKIRAARLEIQEVN